MEAENILSVARHQQARKSSFSMLFKKEVREKHLPLGKVADIYSNILI